MSIEIYCCTVKIVFMFTANAKLIFKNALNLVLENDLHAIYHLPVPSTITATPTPSPTLNRRLFFRLDFHI
eukprot:COSAG02_NODE_6618_length_3455_cov_4.183850_2_plen_71_part_00